MSKQKIADISCKSGRSASTVSKVLRNCPGVDYETREAVRAALGDGDAADLIRRSKRGRICVILPDNPKFFWGKALSVTEESDAAVKIYSSIHPDREDREVARCVSEAVAEDAAAIILAACPDAALRGELARLAKNRLVLQLCEYTPIPNTFFVGSDFYADGLALSNAVTSAHGSRPTVGILRYGNTFSAEERIRGFLDGIGQRARIVWMDSPEPSSLYASHLARAIDRMGDMPDYIFSPFGMTAPVCDSLYKLRGKMCAKYIGFELPTAAQKHLSEGRIAALAIQDPEKQMRLALSLAQQYVQYALYPNQKLNCLRTRFATF